VRFAVITPCVASQRVFIITVVNFVIDSVRKLLDTPPIPGGGWDFFSSPLLPERFRSPPCLLSTGY
jgi:hypothetical protein